MTASRLCAVVHHLVRAHPRSAFSKEAGEPRPDEFVSVARLGSSPVFLPSVLDLSVLAVTSYPGSLLLDSWGDNGSKPHLHSPTIRHRRAFDFRERLLHGAEAAHTAVAVRAVDESS